MSDPTVSRGRSSDACPPLNIHPIPKLSSIERVMASEATLDETLTDAIRKATEERVRATLLSIAKDEVGRKLVEKLLIAPSEGTGEQDEAASTTKKRVRYEMCEQCGEEFDVTENEDGACLWHNGEMEVDWNGGFWDDHDQAIHGRIDDDDSREAYPEGFGWTCCDELGNSEGCQEGAHTARDPRKRLRSSTPSESSNKLPDFSDVYPWAPPQRV